jgi:hypothetical protein
VVTVEAHLRVGKNLLTLKGILSPSGDWEEVKYLQEAQTAERILQALQGEGYPIDDDDIKISGTRGGGE